MWPEHTGRMVQDKNKLNVEVYLQQKHFIVLLPTALHCKIAYRAFIKNLCVCLAVDLRKKHLD